MGRRARQTEIPRTLSLPDPVIQVIPAAGDPLAALAGSLLNTHRDRLPDLSRVTVLLPDLAAAPALRRALLETAAADGVTALLGPRIRSLRDWAMEYLPPDIRTCDSQRQRLILVQALREHPTLIRSANPWALADDLIRLFDELTLNRVELPPDLDDFIRQLEAAYGVDEAGISALGQEASLVFTLWQAWHAELQGMGLTDGQAAYLLALSRSLAEPREAASLYLAGFTSLARAEIDWLRQLLATGQASLWLHGQPATGAGPEQSNTPLRQLLAGLDQHATISTDASDVTRVVDRIYQRDDAPLRERTRRAADEFPASPLRERIAVLAAANAEQEARAIELQVRRWLLAGHRRIGIVTENRRLARRVRALLERADVSLEDAAGWALSTTSAAATLERWLECLEEDFAHLPLLDLLNSPFLFPDQPREAIQLATLRLEQDIILHENIARGLDRYRQHIRDRARRLPGWPTAATRLLLALLDRLEDAAAPLLALRHDSHRPTAWLEALQHSLAGLGLDQGLAEDPAGSRLLQVLEQMQVAARGNDMRFDWADLRTWLGRTLEQAHFQPPVSGSGIFLLGLGQGRLQRFDGVILAGAEREYLPGNPAVSPFFNDAVRRELGLPAGQEQLGERFHHFRSLLQAAPRILITARREQDGEEVVASPWLEALQKFHQLAWGAPLDAGDLPALLTSPDSQVFRADTDTLPEPARRPRPVLAAGLLNRRFSAGAYQQLLDCPYQYYAARCLRLSPPEEIRLALSRADYGQRVHQCLQAFHSDVPGLPGPFPEPLTERNRLVAEGLLNEIAEAVFARDLADNFEHQGWLQQWQRQIPRYLEWQIRRNEKWRVVDTERRQEVELAPKLHLGGQLDRIDRQDNELAVIDYKTGTVPRQSEVDAGEAVQLPVYALLAGAEEKAPVREALYLALENDGTVKTAARLEGEALTTLARDNAARLVDVVKELEAARPLPAWGDSTTCSRCDMALLCRRQAWEEGSEEEEIEEEAAS